MNAAASGGECPICFEKFASDSICTGCGHVFCSPCLQEYLDRKQECPICRTKVTLLIPLYNFGGATNDESLQFSRRYNAQHASANEKVSMKQRIQQDVNVLRRRTGFSRLFRLVLGISLALFIMYLVTPVDLIPDSIPIVGYFDDVLLLIVIVVFIWYKVESDRRSLQN